MDFVLVYEEDKKDVDIEIPKVRKIISTMTRTLLKLAHHPILCGSKDIHIFTKKIDFRK